MATAIGSYVTASLLKTRLGIGDTTDDTVLGLVCDGVNQFIETKTRRTLAPITSATYVFDGQGRRVLDVTETADGQFIGGLRAISQLQVRAQTGATLETLASTDYFLRGAPGPGMPYERVEISDLPTGGYTAFPRGYATVSITATAGPAAIPDDVADVAATVATRAWYAVQSAGGGDASQVGTDAMGAIVIRSFWPKELDTLMAYRRGRDMA